MEWVIVGYPRTRDVFVDGRRCGETNRLLIVREGTQAFHLGTPADYQPAKQKVKVTKTTPSAPMAIYFQPDV